MFNPGTVQTAPFEAEVAKVSLGFARDRCYVAVGRVQRRAPGDFPLDVLVDLDAYDNDLKEAYQPGAQGPGEFIIGLTVSLCAEDRDVIQPLTVTDDRGISLTAVAFERIEHYLEDDLDD